MQLDCNTLHSKLSPAQLENVLLTSPSSLDNVVIPTFPREQLGDVQCTDCGLQTNYLFFTGPPNLSAGIFPTTVNGKKGTESGGSKSDCRTNMFDVKIRKKYYARNEPGTKYVVTLYQISPIGNAAQTYYLYQFKVAQFRNNKSAFIATKHVNNCVQAQPLQYTNKSVPSIQSVSPCEFEHKPHAKEMLTVTGENLQFSAGYLYRAATGTYIPMKVFSERTCTELRLEFVQPAQLYTCVDEYVIFLCEHDSCYMFPNQPVSFHILMAARAKVRTNAPSKELQDSLTALKVSTTITLQLTDLPLDYWIDSNNTLVDVVQQGNTRHLMHLAKLYDGVPIISMKDKVDTISLVDIAVQGNNLCSLLYVIVWDLETKGKFTRDVRERLDEYIYNAKQIVYDEMLESIIGVDDDKQIAVGAEGRLRLHAVVASAAIPNQKVNTWTPPQHLTNVRLVPVHVETIESYFSTADTPENLCDPITCSICERAVVLPISGMTISEHVALSRPRFDFFANSQFGPNQTTTPNKHLRAMVEEYISPKVHSILECLPQEEAFKEALFIMGLLDGRDDLTLSAVCRNKFVTIFWKHIGTLAPQIPGLQQMEKLTLFQILTRGGIFRKEEYFALLMECDRGSKIGCGLCWLFPSVDDAYALLNVGKLLTTENTMSNAKSLLLLFIQHRRVNMLANLFAQCQAQNQQDDTNQLAPVWKVLQFMSKHCAKEDFNLLVHGLPLAVPVIDVLTSDSNLAQSVYAAEQVYKSIILEQKLQNYQAEIVALQNTIKVMGEVMENKIRKLENKNARQAEENAILLPPCGVVKGSNTVFLSEYIKVDVSKIYKFSAELASVGIDGSMDYLGFACYNEEKKEINSFDVLPAGNATVTSVLDKMVQFDGDLLNAVKNPYPCLGFYYDGDVLDRCPDDVANIVPLSATASSIELQDCLLPDVVAKIVPGKTIVRVQYCGDNYVYTAAEGAVLPCQFKKFKGTITGEGLGNARTMFRKGTAYVRIVLLANYRTPNHTVAYRDVKFMAV